MSLSATCSDIAPARDAETRTLLLILWLATVATYLFTSLRGGETLSTDDAMRLVEVRDLLAGQGWFDLTQYRLSPPGGSMMHWSRLIDLPLAILIRAGGLVLPETIAERVATIVWPAALLLVFLAGIARLARELASDAAARLALIFAALMAPVLQHFRPGAIDHHNAQLVLLVWSLALAGRQDTRPRDAAVAGALCALSLAIGQEMAPAIAALAAMIGVRWVVQGETVRRATTAFALSFAAATLALFAATVAPARYTIAACDALSIVQVVTTLIGGVGLAALTSLRGLSSTGRRLGGALGLGLLLGATIAVAFPACLGDPVAQLDPRLSELWLAKVTESRSILTMLHDLPQEVLPYYGLPAAGLVLGLVRCWREREERQWSWILAVAVLSVLTLVALWLVRGAAAANAVAAALVPAALARAWTPKDRTIFLGLGRAALIAALLINPLALIAIGGAVARAGKTPHPTVIADGPGTCRRAADYAPLAPLSRGLVLAFIDAGPFLLMETPHAILAAPYHRNVIGNAAMLDIFLAAPSEAAARMKILGVDYIAFCAGAPDRYNYVASAPEGLVAVLGRGEVPDFLERVALAGTELTVYRVRP
jgi:hypothetical protein